MAWKKKWYGEINMGESRIGDKNKTGIMERKKEMRYTIIFDGSSLLIILYTGRLRKKAYHGRKIIGRAGFEIYKVSRGVCFFYQRANISTTACRT